MFKKILIANRGEIAVRIVRACKELGIATVAVYSDVDRASLHVRVADEAYNIGAAAAQHSYRNRERIIEVARSAGVDAIHPGYGFLAEDAEFAELCTDHEITFIGPNPQALRTMSRKTTSRVAVADAGVPIAPGMTEVIRDEEHCREWATKLGFPVLLKADAARAGQAMRRVDGPDQLAEALQAVQSEAKKLFGDDAVYLERAIANARHVEVQVLGDRHGKLVHLGERDCSVQRKHRKLIEEAPSPWVDAAMRERLGRMAIEAAASVAYDNIGTVEFIVCADSAEVYFLEMTPRLQVEHPVTEMVTGIDLCKEMIRVAAGLELPLAQDDIQMRGHAIECRIFAEDPDNDFQPNPGKVVGLRVPGGPGVRDETGMYEGFVVPAEYSPLISKLVVADRDRQGAIARCRRALSEYIVQGIKTTIPFHRRVLEDESFLTGDYDTTLIDRQREEPGADNAADTRVALVAAAIKAFRYDREQTGQDSSSGTREGGLNPWKLSGRMRSLSRG